MIRSSACQPWQPDLPGHAGDRGDLLSYTTPRDTIAWTAIASDRPPFPPSTRPPLLRSSGYPLADANRAFDFEEKIECQGADMRVIKATSHRSLLSSDDFAGRDQRGSVTSAASRLPRAYRRAGNTKSRSC